VRSPYATPLPHARVGSISGLLELIVEEFEGSVDIPRLAERIQLEVDESAANFGCIGAAGLCCGDSGGCEAD
jgi:hypothetical protein